MDPTLVRRLGLFDYLRNRLAVAGTPDDCVEQVRAAMAAGATQPHVHGQSRRRSHPHGRAVRRARPARGPKRTDVLIRRSPARGLSLFLREVDWRERMRRTRGFGRRGVPGSSEAWPRSGVSGGRTTDAAADGNRAAGASPEPLVEVVVGRSGGGGRAGRRSRCSSSCVPRARAGRRGQNQSGTPALRWPSSTIVPARAVMRASTASGPGSHHDRAMQPADEKTVLGDFNDAKITHFGVTSRFFKRERQVLRRDRGSRRQVGRLRDQVHVRRRSAAAVPDRVSRRPAAEPHHRLGHVKKRWFSLYPDEKIPPGDSLHWTGRYQNWNLMCADCHSTRSRRATTPRPTRTRRRGRRSTSAARRATVRARRTSPGRKRRRAASEPTKGDDGLLVNLKRIDSRGEVGQLRALPLPPHSARHAGAARAPAPRRVGRRTAIGALLHRPALVLLDEPTTGADVRTRAQILRARARARRRGSAVVYSTHYLHEIEELDADVAFIDHGRIVARGRRRARARYGVERARADLRRAVPRGSRRGRGRRRLDRPHPRGRPGARRGRVASAARCRRERAALGSRSCDPSLESVFLAVTGRRYDDADAAEPAAVRGESARDLAAPARRDPRRTSSGWRHDPLPVMVLWSSPSSRWRS